MQSNLLDWCHSVCDLSCDVCILVLLSLRQYPAETWPPFLVSSVSSVLTCLVKAMQGLVVGSLLILSGKLSTSYPLPLLRFLYLFWGSRSATPAGTRCSGVLMIVCLQMVIRAALLCPGLFLIEAQHSRAQLGADQLALPTYLPECCCSCWRHLFWSSSLASSATSPLFCSPACLLLALTKCKFKLIMRHLSISMLDFALHTGSDAEIAQHSLS